MKQHALGWALAAIAGLYGLPAAAQHSHAAHAAAAAPAEPAEHAEHTAHAHAGHAPALPKAPAVLYTPDASLATGIRRAHQAVEVLGHYAMGHVSVATAQDQAQDVIEAVNFMFANCQLAPEPDAALHGILAQLYAGAQAFRSTPTDHDAIAEMQAALSHYPQYFNDPGWDAAAADGGEDAP